MSYLSLWHLSIDPEWLPRVSKCNSKVVVSQAETPSSDDSSLVGEQMVAANEQWTGRGQRDKCNEEAVENLEGQRTFLKTLQLNWIQQDKSGRMTSREREDRMQR